MRVCLRFDGATTNVLRAVAATCHAERDTFTNGKGWIGDDTWQPKVQCEGADFIGIICPPATPEVANRILSEAIAAGYPA